MTKRKSLLTVSIASPVIMDIRMVFHNFLAEIQLPLSFLSSICSHQNAPFWVIKLSGIISVLGNPFFLLNTHNQVRCCVCMYLPTNLPQKGSDWLIKKKILKMKHPRGNNNENTKVEMILGGRTFDLLF